VSDGQVDVLDLVSISKTFPGQRALVEVDFRVREGEVHALLGHNGSGKSTLIKIMSGFHLPDDGSAARPVTYTVAGQPVRFGDPVGVRRAGVRFIHQDIGLVEGLTVLENLRLGTGTYQAATLGPIHWRGERAAAAQRLASLGIDHIDPYSDVSALTAVQRTEVAIARALDDEAAIRLLVLDEATAALPAEQVEHLFGLVRRLAARGVGIVYVTHRLEEVLALADRVTVLRDGAIVHAGAVAEQTRGSLARIIAGTDIAAARPPSAASVQASDPVLELTGVYGGRELRGASLTLYAGEVLGVAGLEGSGVHELVRLLEGSVPLTAGEVRIGGVPTRRFGARALRRHGVAVLPGEKRLKWIPTMSVRENLTISDLAPFWVHGFLRRRAEVRAARDDIDRFGIRPTDPERPIELLSGGNAQKVFVARLVRTSPRVLVLEEPTHGVDVGGSADIVRFVSEVAEQTGTSVLLCSSDTDDLAAACHRVVVLRDGAVTDQLRGEEISRERIVELCYAQS
jgi:ribose transport system ATP-binding protein